MSPSDDLFENPLHPYTKGLLEAIPIPTIGARKNRKLLTGEISSPINPRPGCRFASRCPYAKDVCSKTSPVWEEIIPGHFAACHCVREINNL